MRNLLKWAVLGVALMGAPASAQVLTPINTGRQQVMYDFDGIEASLSLIAYVGEESDQEVSVSLSCSKESTLASVTFEGITPLVAGSPDHAPGMVTIGTFAMGATQYDRMEGKTEYIERPNGHILNLIKALYDGVGPGTLIRASEVDTGPKTSGTRYLVRLSGPFKASAILPEKLSKTIDKDDIRHKLGKFHQLCSIWWAGD